MGAVRWGAVAAVTLGLASCLAAANFTLPFLPPLFGSACKESGVCGKGKCVETSNSTFGYQCHCEDGWTQPTASASHHLDDDEDDDYFLAFLPCVIPNCTFNYTCGNEAAAPSPLLQPKKSNHSIFDPCLWTDCGGGVCNSTSPFTHTCDCYQGYYNLFNSTPFPCYKDCSIGMDCAKLGLNIFNSSNSVHAPPGRDNVEADQSNSHGMRLFAKTWHGWLTAVAMPWALVVYMEAYMI